MSDEKFFSISGVACVAHTPETRKIWRSIKGNKSDFGKSAIIFYAEESGYNSATKDVNEALEYLLAQLRNVFGARSHIIREAIKSYN